MTDKQQPEQPRTSGTPLPDGIPVAGRTPDPAAGPAGDGPTVPLRRPEVAPPGSGAPGEAGEEPTVVAPGSGAPGEAGEEPTVVALGSGAPGEAGDEPTVVAPPDERTATPPAPAKAPPAAGAEPTSGAEPTADEPTADEPTADEQRREPAASPDPVISADDAAPDVSGEAPGVPPSETARTGTERAGAGRGQPPWRRLSSAGALIWVLLALFGFTLVVQLRSNNTDEGLASARQEDLVRILSDLEARDTRLQTEIAALEISQRQLTSGVAGRQAALAEADKRADELGLLAGTIRGRGPGLRISLAGVKASAVLNAVQELRGAGGEVMQLNGTTGDAVRIVASTYFVDAEGGGIVADGTRLGGPYTLWVIGQPETMQTALQIPGGVVASVNSDGGSVTMEQRPSVDVTAVREAGSLQYARPVS